jgi:hypothetical protein
MRLDMLLEWKEVRELIDEGVITEKQISKMFDGMPKEPMGIPATTVGFAEDTFVAFNGMLDVLLDVSGMGMRVLWCGVVCCGVMWCVALCYATLFYTSPYYTVMHCDMT